MKWFLGPAIMILSVIPAAAEDNYPETLARSASLMFYIGEICPNYYTINRELTYQGSLAFAKMGNNAIGVKPFGKLAMKEMERRKNEIIATGAKMWCTYQKGSTNQMNAGIFLD